MNVIKAQFIVLRRPFILVFKFILFCTNMLFFSPVASCLWRVNPQHVLNTRRSSTRKSVQTHCVKTMIFCIPTNTLKFEIYDLFWHFLRDSKY